MVFLCNNNKCTYVCVCCFVAIKVNFSKKNFTVNESDGVAIPVLTLSKPSPCCLNLYVEVESRTASGKLNALMHVCVAYSCNF